MHLLCLGKHGGGLGTGAGSGFGGHTPLAPAADKLKAKVLSEAGLLHVSDGRHKRQHVATNQSSLD